MNLDFQKKKKRICVFDTFKVWMALNLLLFDQPIQKSKINMLEGN